MKLKYQLFLTLLLASATLITIMFVLNSWSLNRGFLDHINRGEMQRIATIADRVALVYQQQDGWGDLPRNRRAWDALVGNDSRRDRRPPRQDRRKQRGDKQRKPPPDSRRDDNRPITIDPRLILADPNKSPLIGRPRPNDVIQWQPVTVNGNVVGYLGAKRIDKIDNALDRAFADQQRRQFAYAAAAMVVLSALLAIPLASRIVKPLLRVNSVVSHISDGDYQHRIDAARKDEIGDLSRNINQLAHTLERNLKARQQWMAEISHELRTPVAVLQGEIEALQDGLTPLDANAVASLHNESTRLARIINDLHELALSDAGALDYHMSPVNMADIVEARLQAHAPVLEKQGLSTAIHNDAGNTAVSGDAHRLAQLFDNLLQNSMRYTDAGGAIDIRFSREGDTLVVNWTDTTPGVDKDHLSKLFDPLFRVEDSRNRESGGAGLGLAIVSRIVEAHRGEIHAYNAPAGGLGILMRFKQL